MAYDLDALGWLQFQRLCDLVLGEERAAALEGDADQLRTGVHNGQRIAVAWNREPVGDIVLSNLGDAVAISLAIDASPEIRRALPSVLGVRAGGPLVPHRVRERSTLAYDEAVRLARVFVPTRAYERALAALDAHRFVVITGPPEMGKTAIARMLALAQLSCGWEAHECTAPEQLWEAFDPEVSQIFVADDAFGSTEYRPEAAEHWARELDRILRRLDDKHRLVWTSRPAPLKAGLRRLHRERGLERFPAPGEVEVDASALDEEEKVLILFRHARAAGLDGDGRALVRTRGDQLVAHPHFTPERIRRFVTDRLPDLLERPVHPEDLTAAVDRELSEPTAAMAASYRALEGRHQALLVAMLDSSAAPVHERDLAAALRRQHDGALPQSPHDLIDRLADHFLRVQP